MLKKGVCKTLGFWSAMLSGHWRLVLVAAHQSQHNPQALNGSSAAVHLNHVFRRSWRLRFNEVASAGFSEQSPAEAHLQEPAAFGKLLPEMSKYLTLTYAPNASPTIPNPSI